MTSEDSHQQPADDCPPPPTDPNCDPKLIDEVACQAKGVAAQAEYNLTYEKALETAKTDYDTTRKAYRTKRHDAALKVQDMRHQIRHLLERIRCQIEQERVWRCIDDAFCEVEKELRCCDPDPGCCATVCEFSIGDTRKMSLRKLIKRIASYQRIADEAKACFDLLVKEPAALDDRVAKAKESVDKINAALNADPASTDLKRVYAEALVANRLIERIWGGFDETRDFVDCLCRALTCWMRGCAAVSILTGAKAVAECREKSEQEHCENLRTNPVDEVLALYDRLCATEKHCDETTPETPNDCRDSDQDPHAPSGGPPEHAPHDHHDGYGRDRRRPERRPCGCDDRHDSDGDHDPIPG